VADAPVSPPPPPGCVFVCSCVAPVFDVGTEGDEELKKFSRYSYPDMRKTQGNFTLHVGRRRNQQDAVCSARRAEVDIWAPFGSHA
jgi:hypothetical protein